VDGVLATLLGQLQEGRVVAGWSGINRWLGRRMRRAHAAGRSSYLLVGVYHDSGGQVAAFRRIIGPLGPGGWTAASAELWDGDGRWASVPLSEQRGDTLPMARYLAGGAPGVWRQLWRRQRAGDYAAWKFGYLDQVMELLVTARASGISLLGCDMPRPLQRRLRVLEPAAMLSLRELHCLWAVRDGLWGLQPPHHVAMLWGQQHVTRSGLSRFLPRTVQVTSLYLLGHRPGPAGVEQGLRSRLALTEPLLVPLPGVADELLLLLPGPHLAARVDRAQDHRKAPAPGRLEFSSTLPGQLYLPPWTLSVDAGRRTIVLPPGHYPFVYSGPSSLLAGGIHLPQRGQLSLVLQPRRREVRLLLTAP
jgi:hypothetical protein